MKIKVKNFRHAWLIAYFILYVLWYILAENTVTDSYTSIHIWIDDLVPFCEYFIVPYVMWYPFFIAVGLHLLCRDAHDFCRYCWMLIIGYSICLGVCMLFPNGQDLRPDAFPRDNVFTWLISKIYSADTNTNVLPSMHVFGSVAAMVAVFKNSEFSEHRLIQAILGVVGVLICLSTMFVKQHSALDGITSIVLYIILYLLIYGPGRDIPLWNWPAEPMKRRKKRTA